MRYANNLPKTTTTNLTKPNATYLSVNLRRPPDRLLPPLRSNASLLFFRTVRLERFNLEYTSLEETELASKTLYINTYIHRIDKPQELPLILLTPGVCTLQFLYIRWGFYHSLSQNSFEKGQMQITSQSKVNAVKLVNEKFKVYDGNMVVALQRIEKT